MTDCRPTRLEDLPAFKILRITMADSPQLLGLFTHLKSVRVGRSWLYADVSSLIGDLVDVNETTRQAKFIAPFWSPSSPIQVGSVPPWLDACWRADQVAMILDPSAVWARVEFAPSPAQHFDSANVHGWTKAGQQLPDDAIPTRIDEVGWDTSTANCVTQRWGAVEAHTDT